MFYTWAYLSSETRNIAATMRDIFLIKKWHRLFRIPRRRLYPVSHFKSELVCGNCKGEVRPMVVTQHWNSIINLANHNVASGGARGKLSD